MPNFVLDKRQKTANICTGIEVATEQPIGVQEQPKVNGVTKKGEHLRPLTVTYLESGFRLPEGEQKKGKVKMATTTIPYIDRNVQHVGVSRLRSLNATQLREIDKTLVIQENDQPLAVLLKYEEFLIMQDQLLSVLDTIAALTDNAEMSGIAAGIAEMNAGKTKSIAEIRGALKTKKEKG